VCVCVRVCVRVCVCVFVCVHTCVCVYMAVRKHQSVAETTTAAAATTLYTLKNKAASRCQKNL